MCQNEHLPEIASARMNPCLKLQNEHLSKVTFPQKLIFQNLHMPEFIFGRNYITPKIYFPEFTLVRIYFWPKSLETYFPQITFPGTLVF